MCCSQTLTLQDMENYLANIKEILVMFFFSWVWFIDDKQHADIEITGSKQNTCLKVRMPRQSNYSLFTNKTNENDR